MQNTTKKIKTSKIPLVLASSSPRRKAIMSQVGLSFITEPSNIDEDYSIKMPPKAFCEYWAREKAKYVAVSHNDKLVIGADTIVLIDGKILGKPLNRKESFKMLKSLSGKTHEVLTGVSLIHLDLGIDFKFNVSTKVSFYSLTNDDIYNYINIYNPFDKAGSYGIQDGFSVYVKKINGCFYNVMGFPISKFYRFFKTIKEEGKIID